MRFGAGGQVEEEGRLLDGQVAIHAGLDDQQAFVQGIAPAIADRGAEHIQPIRLRAVQIEEHRATLEVVLHPGEHIVAHGLE
ncbi:MAG TPA: hypothetical protein PLW86_10235, partial [Rhodocyclaceae bacterium]|nr:hypothetical protein [Rhodocyclaceae bacterium]